MLEAEITRLKDELKGAKIDLDGYKNRVAVMQNKYITVYEAKRDILCELNQLKIKFRDLMLEKLDLEKVNKEVAKQIEEFEIKYQKVAVKIEKCNSEKLTLEKEINFLKCGFRTKELHDQFLQQSKKEKDAAKAKGKLFCL